MKAVFISYNQAHTEDVQALLDSSRIRGFTQWTGVMGRGSSNGEPHFGNHAWPAMNVAILAMVDDSKVEPLLKKLHELDLSAEQQGLRAFVWNVEETI
jgi:hypothetical protein